MCYSNDYTPLATLPTAIPQGLFVIAENNPKSCEKERSAMSGCPHLERLGQAYQYNGEYLPFIYGYLLCEPDFYLHKSISGCSDLATRFDGFLKSLFCND